MSGTALAIGNKAADKIGKTSHPHAAYLLMGSLYSVLIHALLQQIFEC